MSRIKRYCITVYNYQRINKILYLVKTRENMEAKVFVRAAHKHFYCIFVTLNQSVTVYLNIKKYF